MLAPLAGLQNDHQAVMKQVEEALHQLHARDKEKQARDQAEARQEALSSVQSPRDSPQRAFARVGAISVGSPASNAVSPLWSSEPRAHSSRGLESR